MTSRSRDQSSWSQPTKPLSPGDDLRNKHASVQVCLGNQKTLALLESFQFFPCKHARSFLNSAIVSAKGVGPLRIPTRRRWSRAPATNKNTIARPINPEKPETFQR